MMKFATFARLRSRRDLRRTRIAAAFLATTALNSVVGGAGGASDHGNGAAALGSGIFLLCSRALIPSLLPSSGQVNKAWT